MCELFGVSSSVNRDQRDLLREFFSHSDSNPHGWGIVTYPGSISSSGSMAPEIVKSPEKASESRTLERVMDAPVSEKLMMAHIRFATKGQVSPENTHPFINKDRSGIRWTLVHNGTIFENDELSEYFHVQKGETDSERILFCLTDRMNRMTDIKGSRLTEDDRIKVVEDLLRDITPVNKVNILISDGVDLYAHTNLRESMFMLRRGGKEQSPFGPASVETIISSRPLTDEAWKELPLNTLLVFRDGEQIYEGTPHSNEFIETEEKIRYLFLDYAGM